MSAGRAAGQRIASAATVRLSFGWEDATSWLCWRKKKKKRRLREDLFWSETGRHHNRHHHKVELAQETNKPYAGPLCQFFPGTVSRRIPFIHYNSPSSSSSFEMMKMMMISKKKETRRMERKENNRATGLLSLLLLPVLWCLLWSPRREKMAAGDSQSGGRDFLLYFTSLNPNVQPQVEEYGGCRPPSLTSPREEANPKWEKLSFVLFFSIVHIAVPYV